MPNFQSFSKGDITADNAVELFVIHVQMLQIMYLDIKIKKCEFVLYVMLKI